MSIKTIIPDRYYKLSRNKVRYKYKCINVYKMYQNHIKLLVVDRLSQKTILTIILEKDDFKRVSEHHWGGTKGVRPPCSSIDDKSITIGQFIGNSDFLICGKRKGNALWDFRHNQYSESGNIYTSVGENIMKLEIYRRKSDPYSVIFDKEDYAVVSKYIWRVEKDNRGTYSVITRDNYKQVSMHSYLLKIHGQKPGKKGFKNIECKDYLFDFRKSVLYKNHALNIYTFIDKTTVELTLNSVHGVIKVIFDRKDYERVSNISWVYKKNNSRYMLHNYKYGSLKRFILSSTKQNFNYIIEKKDKSGRLDFRKKTLLKCLK